MDGEDPADAVVAQSAADGAGGLRHVVEGIARQACQGLRHVAAVPRAAEIENRVHLRRCWKTKQSLNTALALSTGWANRPNTALPLPLMAA